MKHQQPRRLRVWFFTELYWPEETSTGYFLTRIAEDVAADAEVFAVCSQPTYKARGKVAPRREVRAGVQIRRLRSTALNKDNLLFRLINMVTFSTAVLVHAFMGLRRGDVAVAVTNPPIVPYLVRLVSLLRGARFVLLVHDVYPDVLIATGILRADTWPVRLLSSVSGWLYRSAERTVVLGRDMQRLVSDRLSGNHAPPIVIPNWGDVESIRPDGDARSRARAELEVSGKFVVQYLGNMGRTHDLQSIVHAAARLRDHPGIHFMIVGWGARRDWVAERIEEELLSNIRLLPPCPAEALNRFLNAADVGIIAFRRGMAGISVPSRLYNVMAAGLPVIAVADDESELAHVVREEQIGWVLPPEDPGALVDLVKTLERERDTVLKIGLRSREVAELRYSRDAATVRWQRLLSALNDPTPDSGRR